MSQSLSKIYVHLVFSTKGRTHTIPKLHIKEIHAYIAQTLNDNHCPAIIVGGTFNHVHILFVQSKTMSLSDIVRTIKASSSKFINERNSTRNPFGWQDGYGAFSISQSHVNAVRQYIENQEENHKTVDFKDEFRKLCKLFEIDIDERYLWE